MFTGPGRVTQSGGGWKERWVLVETNNHCIVFNRQLHISFQLSWELIRSAESQFFLKKVFFSPAVF